MLDRASLQLSGGAIQRKTYVLPSTGAVEALLVLAAASKVPKALELYLSLDGHSVGVLHLTLRSHHSGPR